MAASKKISPFISDMDMYLFGTGTHYDIYKKLGAHLCEKDGKKGVYFAVWAPNAKEVRLITDYNGWNEDEYHMTRLEPAGIHEIFIPGMGIDSLYKYLIFTQRGDKLYKADPFANKAELRPGTASVTADYTDIRWGDSAWMKKRAKADLFSSPIAIYECHIGSWMRHPGREDEGFYTYREFADRMTEYLLDMHYTHIELIGIAEHPFDGSWGYQVTGYYAPTTRYGSLQDFAYMINKFHKNNIGIILDWVPAHFPRDAHGLADFDGQALFEYADPRKGEHPDWGTKIFDYGKLEVKNFLIANAIFWLKEFHIDGLRVDAVASMLYLDYGKKDGAWIPNKYGGNHNLEAIEFFKHLNSYIKGVFPGVMMIAEESTAWPMMTHSVEEGGMGFDYKWNMGWMNDFLSYMKLDPLYRKYHHNELTFSMMYAFSEKFILVLSHDEVVHEKGSMIQKMPGGYEDKFSNLRAAYGFMMTHPGSKLLFMGQEFAQFTEFNESGELDWSLFEFDAHKYMQGYVKQLNKLYKTEPALYELDSKPEGFSWISVNDANRSVVSYERRGSKEEDTLVVICNFTPVEQKNYKLGVPSEGKWGEIFSSDNAKFGGEGRNNKTAKLTKAGKVDDRDQYIQINVPALSVSVFKKKATK